MPPSATRTLLGRCAMGLTALLIFKWMLLDGKSTTPPGEIAHAGLLDRISSGVSLHGQSLDPRQHSFLQSRLGRRDTVPREEDEAIALLMGTSKKGSKGSVGDGADVDEVYVERERVDLFDAHIKQGIRDFWTRFQLPFATNAETMHLDEQVVKGVVDELMSFNGWAAAACSSLTRPFAASRKDDTYPDLTNNGQLYYFALVVHSADHFLIDQVAAIVQLSRRLGPSNIFVSLLDYASTDSTPFLSDLTEMVFTLLGISFRIKRIPPMTRDPAAAYYPMEEAYTRNLALEPLLELYHRRKVKFAKVIWLKGFTCPNDILETLRVSSVNRAAMTCSMDWKEHNGFFIYNDRWRTRDMDGNLFRGSKSTSPIDEAPPRDVASIQRYAQHLPFQVFCCESGVHIIDPAQSFYQGLTYRSSIEHGIFNISAAEDGKAPKWSEGPCMDSAQMHFCRDLWMLSARDGVRADAKKARDRERKGLPRGLSDEMEKIVKAVAPQYAPAEKGTGGFLGFGGGKAVPAKVADTLQDDEEDEEEWEEEDPAAPAAGADRNVGQDGAPAKEEKVIKEQTPEEKEQAMAADAAAAALPVEEQHPAGGADQGTLQDEQAATPADAAGAVAPGAALEDQFVDPEAMLEKEAQALAAANGKPVDGNDQDQDGAIPPAAGGDDSAKQAEGGNPAGGRMAALREQAKQMAEDAKAAVEAFDKAGRGQGEDGAAAAGAADEAQKPEVGQLVKRGNPDPLVKRDDQEKLVNNLPGPADPAALRDNVEGGKKRPASVNNADEADDLDAAAPQAPRLGNAASSSTLSRSKALKNAAFNPARILVNPRCVTTYAGVSHTQLAMDLFGSDEDEDLLLGARKNTLDDDGPVGTSRSQTFNDKFALHEFGAAAETFVCQEMRTSGGRSAPKQQRRTGFSIARGLMEGWQPR